MIQQRCLNATLDAELLVCFSGKNLVPKPSFEVQEVVEKWRNPARAACGLQRVSTSPLAASQRGLGLRAQPENEHCKHGGFVPEQQPPEHNYPFISDKLPLVLIHELCDPSTATASPQHNC